MDRVSNQDNADTSSFADNNDDSVLVLNETNNNNNQQSINKTINNNNNNKNNNLGDDIPISVSPTVSETIYEFGTHFENPTHVVSEKVQNLASQIYNELQKIMNRFSDDEDTAVNGLMPLIVNVLESLDLALIENQQLQVDLELCKDDNEQLVQVFEKEKQNKKKIEQRLFEYEFATEEEKQQYQQRIDSLANIVKMLELKTKNSSDHSVRLEEKESELKKEYNKLHDRYNELLRSHFDVMERVKIMFGNEDASASNLNSLNLANLQQLKSKFAEEMIETTDAYPTIASSTTVEPDQPRNTERLAAAPQARQAWLETEMSYDDTTTIIEDVEELQKVDRDNRDIRDRDQSLSVTDNFFGMEKEIENLITENNELLATKNALNIVKDDLIAKVDELQSELAMCKNEIQQREAVQDRLKSRINQVEEDLKKKIDELDETKQKLASLKEDNEEDMPSAQRKRFTRVEMTRVLMERNLYKEKCHELQDALRWSDLSRSKAEEKRSVIWKFFNSLFNPSPTGGGGAGWQAGGSTTSSNSSMTPSIRYSPSVTSTPAMEAMRLRARQQNEDLVLMVDSDLSSERNRAQKHVRTHVNRSGGNDRIQAYGWSITGNPATQNLADSTKKTLVPVPIYCRPFGGADEIGMKIWCAAAVDLTGGEAGFPITANEKAAIAAKDSDNSLADLESELNEAIKSKNADDKESKLSCFVWICSVSHSKSKVTIINAFNNPGEVLDSFYFKTHLLCIASVPGAKTADLLGSAGVTIDESAAPELTLCRREEVNNQGSTKPPSGKSVTFSEENVVKEEKSPPVDDNLSNVEPIEKSKTISPPEPLSGEDVNNQLARSVTLEKLSEYVAYVQPPSPNSQVAGEQEHKIPSAASSLPIQPMSTCLPTMWLGGQNCILYVHSGIAQWSHCIATIRLSDSIMDIIHFRGRVFVALANGKCCIFVRSEQTGEWDFENYYCLDIGAYSLNQHNKGETSTSTTKTADAGPTALHAIRCLEISKEALWLGYRNMIFIVNTCTLKVIHSFVAHPRKETYIRQITALGDGVWCCFRLDTTLRLYSAFEPYHHVQNIDIEPYIGKVLPQKSFNFVRITSLRACYQRLWVGTSNGIIVCLPCAAKSADSTAGTSATNTSSGALALSTYMPLCDLNTTQLSFHGHKDNVKFFISTQNRILSGGEGYIDFRANESGDDTATMPSLSRGDRSHLIVWEITSNMQLN